MAFDGLELSPEQAARYADVRPLGRGGMGETWRARDLKFDRDVVLKTLRADRAEDEPLRRRFEREVRALARVAHANVVRILDCFEAPCGLVYVMDYVGGSSLRDRFAAGGPTADEVLGFVAGVAEGLAAIHGAGLLHRDLKPDNVMVDPAGKAVIIDFGLVGCLQGLADGVQFQRITRTGQIMGTLGYLPPETLWGRTHDERSDVFQAGVMLYEGLTGRLPYDSTAFVGVAAGRPVSPAPAPSSLRTGLSAELDRLALAVVALEPDARPPSASILARACRALAGGESLPVDAVPPEPLRTRPLAAAPMQAPRRSRQGAAPHGRPGFVASMSQRVALKARAWWVLPAWARVVSATVTVVLSCVLGSSLLSHLGYEVTLVAPSLGGGSFEGAGPPRVAPRVVPTSSGQAAVEQVPTVVPPRFPSAARPKEAMVLDVLLGGREPATPPGGVVGPDRTGSEDAVSSGGGMFAAGLYLSEGLKSDLPSAPVTGSGPAPEPGTVIACLQRATRDLGGSLVAWSDQGDGRASSLAVELVEAGLRHPGLFYPPDRLIERQSHEDVLDASRAAGRLTAGGRRYGADPALGVYEELRGRHALAACVSGGAREPAALEAACGVTLAYAYEVLAAPNEPAPVPDAPGVAILTGSFEAGDGHLSRLVARVATQRGYGDACRGWAEVGPGPTSEPTPDGAGAPVLRFRVRGADPRLAVRVWFGSSFVGRVHFPMGRETFAHLGPRRRLAATVDLLVLPELLDRYRSGVTFSVTPVAPGLGGPAVVLIDRVRLFEGSR